MSLMSQILSYGKDIVLLTERVDTLLQERKLVMAKLEDHEQRLVRIETLIEIASRQRRLPRRE
jgi:hypothetical protein